MLQCNARYPLELHVVHAKVGEADYLDTPRGLSVTGFFFELDGVRGEGGNSGASVDYFFISGQHQLCFNSFDGCAGSDHRV